MICETITVDIKISYNYCQDKIIIVYDFSTLFLDTGANRLFERIIFCIFILTSLMSRP